MKQITLTITVVLLLLNIASAQQTNGKSLFFTGAVMDNKQQTALPYAKFQINNKKKGVADISGRFSFQVNVGDTIRYSYLGYRDLQIIINDSLKQNAYLFGVFMTRDTIALNEVVILPRFGNFKEAFIRANPNTSEYVRATNNVNSAIYEALTKTFSPDTKMDAKDNTDMVLKQHIRQIEYKGMISPDNMVGISTINTLPEIKRLQRKRKLKIPNNVITDKEIKLLKRMGKFHKK